MTPMRWFIVLLVASVNFACGSRSGLPGFESELGGTGGSVHTGGSGGVGGSGGNGGNGGNGGKGGNGRNGGHGGHGGDGGTGAVGAAAGSGGVGGIAECSETLLEGIAGVVGSSKHDEFDPALAASTDNGSRVTLMFRWRALSAIEPIGLPPPKLGHLDFDAWEASWPASLGQAWVAQSYGSGGSFALGDAPGDAHAFLFHDDGFTTGFIGAAFAPSAVPKGVSPQVAQLLPVPSRSLFVVRGQFDQLVGFEETIAPLNRLVYGRYQDGKFFAFKDSGCTNNLPIAASAVRVPSAYLVALYSLSPFGAACTFAGGNEMQLVRFDDGGWPKLVWKIGTDTGVRQLALVRTTNRIWFLHQAELGGAAINAIALDTTGTQLESVGPVVPSNTTNGPFAATAIGSRLVIAYPNFNKTSVHIDVFAPSGAKSFSITPSGPAPPPYGILGAPGGNRLLVAWAATNASGEKRVQVARYCFPAE